MLRQYRTYGKVLEQPGAHDVRGEFRKYATTFLVLLSADFQFRVTVC